jgi:phosphoribosyl 1,2-cyclic phosphodiesterase
MATLKVLGSSSKGNGYVLECDNEKLIIELGVKWNEIAKGVDYKIQNVKACLVTHKHLDHSLSVKDALNRGLSVYSCSEVQMCHPEAKVLGMGKKTRIGGFLVQPIPLHHNVECIGFLIEHKAMGRMVFCTDTNTIPYKFKDIHHFVAESNYSDDIMIDNMCNNIYSQSASENHMSIDDTTEFLKNNYSKSLRTITLIHLSDGNSDAKAFKEHVQNELAFPYVYIADKGVVIDVSKDPF